MSSLKSTTTPATFAARKPGLNWQSAVVCCALVVAFLPLLYIQATILWATPHYQFFPLVLIGSVALAWRNWNRDLHPRPVGRRLPAQIAGYTITAAGWFLLAFASLARSPWLTHLSALVTIVGIVPALGGIVGLRRFLPTLALLWLTLPPPSSLDRDVIIRLQGLTTRGASRFLDWLSVFHHYAGSTIEVAGQRFSVEDACSGIHSLNAAVAATLFFALWVGRGPFAIAFLLIATVVCVLGANIARVSTVVLAGLRGNIDLGSGWRHELLGFVVFGVVLTLVYCADRLRHAFALTISSRRRSKSTSKTAVPDVSVTIISPPHQRQVYRSRILPPLGIAVAFVLLGALQLERVLNRPRRNHEGIPIAKLDGLNADAMPDRWQDWTRQEFRTHHTTSLLGANIKSRVWRYQVNGISAVLSLDYPYWNWHDLPVCYQNQGWRAAKRRIITTELEREVVESKFERSIGEYGYLLFGMFDDQWRSLAPPSSELEATMLARWSGTRLGELNSTLQLQLFVESSLPLTTEQQTQAQALFQAASVILAKRLGSD